MRFHLCSFWIKYNPACTKIIYVAFTEFLISFFSFFYNIEFYKSVSAAVT